MILLNNLIKITDLIEYIYPLGTLILPCKEHGNIQQRIKGLMDGGEWEIMNSHDVGSQQKNEPRS